jgi:UDP-glucose 4-epimerase
MRYLVTGGAGFIGSHMVDALMERDDVVVFDNLSSGRPNLIAHHEGRKGFKFVKADLLDADAIKGAMEGIDFVYHFAANPDVRHGPEHTRIDLEQGPIATHNLLEAMRAHGVKRMAFSSSSTVYGETNVLPTPETNGPMLPISLYGASKLACEGMISAHCHTFGIRSCIYRFANVIGERETHGVIVDFIEKLKKDPTTLEILGDGNQKKSYFLVQDCVKAMRLAVEKSKDQVSVYNIGCDDWLSVRRVAEIVVEEMGRKGVKFKFTGGSRGWVGDIPRTWLDIGKIKSLGWKPSHSSEDAVRACARLLINELVMKY